MHTPCCGLYPSPPHVTLSHIDIGWSLAIFAVCSRLSPHQGAESSPVSIPSSFFSVSDGGVLFFFVASFDISKIDSFEIDSHLKRPYNRPLFHGCYSQCGLQDSVWKVWGWNSTRKCRSRVAIDVSGDDERRPGVTAVSSPQTAGWNRSLTVEGDGSEGRPWSCLLSHLAEFWEALFCVWGCGCAHTRRCIGPKGLTRAFDLKGPF